jgi:hypothetical protein
MQIPSINSHSFATDETRVTHMYIRLSHRSTTFTSKKANAVISHSFIRRVSSGGDVLLCFCAPVMSRVSFGCFIELLVNTKSFSKKGNVMQCKDVLTIR